MTMSEAILKLSIIALVIFILLVRLIWLDADLAAIAIGYSLDEVAFNDVGVRHHSSTKTGVLPTFAFDLPMVVPLSTVVML